MFLAVSRNLKCDAKISSLGNQARIFRYMQLVHLISFFILKLGCVTEFQCKCKIITAIPS